MTFVDDLYNDLWDYAPDDDLPSLPLSFCQERQVVILGRDGDSLGGILHVGMTNIEDESTIKELTTKFNCEIKPVQLNLHEILKVLKSRNGGAPKRGDEYGHIIDLEENESRKANPDSSPTDLVDLLLIDAISSKASDIHLENYPDDFEVRFRIDGIMERAFSHISPQNIAKVTSRLKVLGGLDITETRNPQDGRFRVTLLEDGAETSVDCRINIIPGPAREDIVIRIHTCPSGQFDIDSIGFREPVKKQFLTLVNNPEGLILVTGPTGSGKTTTLYTAIKQLYGRGKKIVTAEDPIEYRMKKVNQKQVGDHLNLAGLARAFLHHDPDVILLGDIRDSATAEVATEAATTGHLVLSSLHTHDAVGAIERLRGMGLPNYEIAHSLFGVLAQRLIRKICSDCAEDHPQDDDRFQLLGDLLERRNARIARGCEKCSGTGYVGRTGIFELLLVDDELHDMIFGGASGSELRTAMRKKGSFSLLEDAVEKVSSGITTIDEIFRIIPQRQILSAIQRA